MRNAAVELARLRKIPVWANGLVILCALLTAMGGVIAMVKPEMLVGPQAEISEAVRIYAGYLTARNLTLAAMLTVLLMIGARRTLGSLVAIVGFIQLADFVVDCAEARWTVAAGVLVLGILLLVAAARISGAGFWKREAWS
jgi:hypothetical protein